MKSIIRVIDMLIVNKKHIVFAVLLIAATMFAIRGPNVFRETADDLNRKLLEDLYKGVSGFAARTNKESQKSTVDTTYGELTFQGAQTLINELRNLGMLNAHDMFIDVGCGVGKLAFHVALTTPAQVTGIEVVRDRYEMAMDVWTDRRVRDVRGRVSFWRGDATLYDVSKATILYMCSTCFPKAVLDEIVGQLQPGTIIITAVPLEQKSFFGKFIKSVQLEATWSKSVAFYIYIK